MAEEKPNTETPGAEAQAPCRARLERIKPISTFSMTQHLKMSKVKMLLIQVGPKSIAYIQHHPCVGTLLSERKRLFNVVSQLICANSKPMNRLNHSHSFHLYTYFTQIKRTQITFFLFFVETLSCVINTLLFATF